MLVLCHIDSNENHYNTSRIKYLMLSPQDTLLL